MEVKQYTFNQDGRLNVGQHPKGKNWPVVYLISNDTYLYIGETTSAYNRMDQHLQNPEKQRLKFDTIRIIFDDEYSKSVVLDYEQKLIKCFTTDRKFKIVKI